MRRSSQFKTSRSSEQRLQPSVREGNLADELMQLEQQDAFEGEEVIDVEQDEIYSRSQTPNIIIEPQRHSLLPTGNVEAIIKKINKEQGISISQSQRSDSSKQSKPSISQPTESLIMLNRSLRTQSKKVILKQIGEIQESSKEQYNVMSHETSKYLALGSEGNTELPFDKLLDDMLITSPATQKQRPENANSPEKSKFATQQQDSNLKRQTQIHAKNLTHEQLMKKSRLFTNDGKSPSAGSTESPNSHEKQKLPWTYDEKRKTISFHATRNRNIELSGSREVLNIGVTTFEEVSEKENEKEAGEANDVSGSKDEDDPVDQMALKQRQLLFEKSEERPAPLITLHMCDTFSSEHNASKKNSGNSSIIQTRNVPDKPPKQHNLCIGNVSYPPREQTNYEKLVKFLMKQQKDKSATANGNGPTNRRPSAGQGEHTDNKKVVEGTKNKKATEIPPKKRIKKKIIPKKQNQKYPDSKMSNPTFKHDSPFRVEEASGYVKLSDTYREKLRQKRTQQTAKEKTICTFKPDLSLTQQINSSQQKKSTASQVTKRLAQGNYMSSPVKIQENKIQKLGRNLGRTSMRATYQQSTSIPSYPTSITEYSDTIQQLNRSKDSRIVLHPAHQSARSMNEFKKAPKVRKNDKKQSKRSSKGDSFKESIGEAVCQSDDLSRSSTVNQSSQDTKNGLEAIAERLKKKNKKKRASPQKLIFKMPHHSYSQSFPGISSSRQQTGQARPVHRIEALDSTRIKHEATAEKEFKFTDRDSMSQSIKSFIARQQKATPKLQIEEQKKVVKEEIYPETVQPTPFFPTEASKANSGTNSRPNEREEPPRTCIKSTKDVVAKMMKEEYRESLQPQRPKTTKSKGAVAKESRKTKISGISTTKPTFAPSSTPAARDSAALKVRRTNGHNSTRSIPQLRPTQDKTMYKSQGSLTQQRWNPSAREGAWTQRERERSRTPIPPPFAPVGDERMEGLLLAAQRTGAKVTAQQQAHHFTSARLYLHDLLHSDRLNLDL